jgi:hypothetical protein
VSLALREVRTDKDVKEFIHLPEKIHKSHAAWLPPLYSDEKKYFNPAINPSFRSCDFRMLLAYRGGTSVGRVMGIINRQHNDMMNLKNVRFSFLECPDDRGIAHALLNDIEEWGRQKGMNNIVGPFGFSERDVQGLLVEGFEHAPVIDTACNQEYMPELVSREGYVKDIDCVIYRHPLDAPLPEVFPRLYERVVSKKAYRFLEFTSRKQLKPYVVPSLKLINESFSKIYGFVPMDEVEMMFLAKRYIPLLDPRFVKIVTKDESVVGFLVSMPNPYRGLQKSRGRLFPFGILHILYALRRATTVNTMLGAVHPDHQKQGLDLFLALSTFRSAAKAGIKSVDTHIVMERNNDMVAEFNRYGAFLIKRFRIYRKPLT